MSSRFTTPLLLEKRKLDMIYFVRHCSSIKKKRGIYGIFILDILTFDSNFNLCNIHLTLPHCSLKYYNDKNNRTRITYFVLTQFWVFSKKNTHLLEFIIYKRVGEFVFFNSIFQIYGSNIHWF